MANSVSKWVCSECDDQIQETTYEEMALSGTPICKECGEDMVFESERWEE